MRKGISPIVAVVLLIAIAVIAAVGLYFWVGGLATKQPTPGTPSTITATCDADNTIFVTNIGASSISASDMDAITYTASSGSIGSIVTSGNGCDQAVALASGATCVYSTGASGAGFIYGASIAQAAYSC